MDRCLLNFDLMQTGISLLKKKRKGALCILFHNLLIKIKNGSHDLLRMQNEVIFQCSWTSEVLIKVCHCIVLGGLM